MTLRPVHRMIATILLLVLCSSCNMPSGTTAPATGVPAPATELPAGAMQVRFVNLTDGGSVAGSLNYQGKYVVTIQVEVTGVAPVNVSLTANGLPALDADGHAVDVANSDSTLPFSTELQWAPLSGGGDYTLVVTAMDDNKNLVQAAARVTVTGIPAFTPTPPPLSRDEAARKVAQIIAHEFGATVPLPSLQRFDFPEMPNRSRWSASVYYQGMFYYIELFDDTHYEWGMGSYSNQADRPDITQYVFCRPTGLYKILVVFNDYGNLPGLDRDEILAQVSPVVTWLNGLYASFASSQGLGEPLMQVAADAVYLSPTPAPDGLLTAEQILSATGVDPASYDLVFQIDLDANNTVGQSHWKGAVEHGGGIALQGCATPGEGDVNVWSVVTSAAMDEIRGTLVMDFNHELSHLFGMSDSWPFLQGVPGPFGSPIDDWIPYTMFGWTDADGDGVPEIIDPTPYGTSGPQP